MLNLINLSQLMFNFLDIFKYAGFILLAFLILMVMITIHEFGHFIAGRKLGFKINEFSIGFGKVLFQKTTKDGILVSLRLIPLGGYCAFDGEDEDDESEGSFNSQKPWKRLIVQFMGAFFNFLSACIFSAILLFFVGYTDRLQITEVDVNSNPSISQLMKDDVIIAVNDVKTSVVNNNYFNNLIAKYDVGEEFNVTVNRGGEVLEPITVKKVYYYTEKLDNNGTTEFKIANIKYTITEIEKEGKTFYKIKNLTSNVEAESEFGIFQIDGIDYKYLKDSDDLVSLKLGVGLKMYKHNFFEAIGRAVPFTCEWAWQCLVLFGELVTGQLGLEGVGGPITTISSIVELTMNSLLYILVLFPLISVNLAVFNLLPIPALDGARMVFTAIEWIFKKPINRKVEGYIHSIGLIVLFALVIFLDVFNIFF